MRRSSSATSSTTSSRSRSLLQLKLQSQARDQAEATKQRRNRDLLVLIADFLSSAGYHRTVAQLTQESGGMLERFKPADNMDLAYCLTEFEHSYEYKFGRRAKLVRKRAANEPATTTTTTSSHATTSFPSDVGVPTAIQGKVGQGDGAAPRETNAQKQQQQRVSSGGGRRRSRKKRESASMGEASASSTPAMTPSPAPDVSVAGSALSVVRASRQVRVAGALRPSVSSKPEAPAAAAASEDSDAPDELHEGFFARRLLKPLPDMGAEFRQLAETITRDIYTANPNVRWDDVAELHDAKQLLQEAVVMPLRFPQFFTGLLQPWKGVLLYGPPGTGKTMLARAVATECQTTFFNISASSIVSKWRGDSEKLVRVLFELARYHSPSTIFIDEMDAIMGRRDSRREHEGSRRMKTELLVQMDGLARNSSDDSRVFVLAASNLPWELDQAMLRRLEKRILVPLPNKKARRILFESHLPEGERASGLDYDKLADATEGFSGADVVLLCKESAMRPIRRLMDKIKGVDWSEASLDAQLDLVTTDDVMAALACTKPSTGPKLLAMYSKWQAAFGAGYSHHDEEEEVGVDDDDGDGDGDGDAAP